MTQRFPRAGDVETGGCVSAGEEVVRQVLVVLLPFLDQDAGGESFGAWLRLGEDSGDGVEDVGGRGAGHGERDPANADPQAGLIQGDREGVQDPVSAPAEHERVGTPADEFPFPEEEPAI